MSAPARPAAAIVRRMRNRRRALLAVVLPAALGPQPGAPPSVDPAVLELRPKVLATWPHDRSAFTQGLLWHGDSLYESTGGYGSSTLRRVDVATGSVLEQVELEPEFFGEGLALFAERLIQLTWREGTAFVYERAGLAARGRLEFAGEGWGLCSDGTRLIMSDGSDALTLRDPQDLRQLGRLPVTLRGRPLRGLNELEWADGWIYANVWTTDTIVRIDPRDGRVRATIDASGLLPPAERARADVLNGIAHNPQAGTFLVTGKLWPHLYEVVFIER